MIGKKFVKKEILAKTPKHEINLELYYDFVDVGEIVVKKQLFEEMCKKGCVNYNNKYSCPPFSPEFFSYVKDKKNLLVVLLKADLEQQAFKEYPDHHKLRMGNAVIKPRLERLMRLLEAKFGSKFLSTGACRLCKPCKRKLSEPCKHPEKMRFSLESMGVDCNKLSEDAFDMPLFWYKDKTAPRYTCVICALPLKQIQKKNEIACFIDKITKSNKIVK